MFETEFAAIRKRVEELNQAYPQCHYIFGATAKTSQIADFERRYSLCLPEEYVAFVSEVGGDVYDENDPQFDFLLPIISKYDQNFKLFSCPVFWQERNKSGTKEARRWKELTKHEQAEAPPALLLHEDPCYTHYLLLLNGTNYGEVWRCSEYKPRPQPMLSTSGKPMSFLKWMIHLFEADF